MTSRAPLVTVGGATKEMPVGDTVPVANGGTGATTVAAAVTNLGSVFLRRTTDLARNTTAVLADDTQIAALPVVANTIYVIEGLVIVDGPTGGDFQFAITCPTGAVINYSGLGPSIGVSASPYNMTGAIATASGTSVPFGTLGIGTKTHAWIRGLLRVAATITNGVTLQWAQANSAGTNTTLFTDSFLRLSVVG